MKKPVRKKKYALLSVSDKTGIAEFAKQLVELGYELVSTGGTAKILSESGLRVMPISEITGNPESFDGRMKTISFQVESGILFDRDDRKHVAEAKALGIKPIDVVVCNLYPFENTVAQPAAALASAVESIDVGGPTMVRAAAKNFKHVAVIVDPGDYERLAAALRQGDLDLNFRQELAAKAFWHLSFYDAQIAGFLNRERFPAEITLPGRKTGQLRYGENPHQQAALYLAPNTGSPLGRLKRISGRELSLTNLTDINAGLEAVKFFKEPAAAVIKHNNPCGLALGTSAAEALARAIEADAESAFGGVIVLNQPLDRAAAELIGRFKDERRGNIDIVASPAVDGRAAEFLRQVRKSMGVYTFGILPPLDPRELNLKWVGGGFVLQDADHSPLGDISSWTTATKRKPSERERRQLRLAWQFLARIRSNAVIVVDGKLPMTRGIGTGQTSRVRATKIALEQAGTYTRGAVLASDSFFPFDDSVRLAAAAGIRAIAQQGGSVNDQASIIAADEADLTMVFTHRRAFWH